MINTLGAEEMRTKGEDTTLAYLFKTYWAFLFLKVVRERLPSCVLVFFIDLLIANKPPVYFKCSSEEKCHAK